MTVGSRRFVAVLVFYMAWLGALAGLGYWSGRAPEAQAVEAPAGAVAR